MVTTRAARGEALSSCAVTAGAWLSAPGALASAKAGIALWAAALLAWDWAARRRGGADPRQRLRDGLLAATVALAALAWWDFAPARAWRDIHPWEFYHHFVGAKYFRELGYSALYDCAVVADYEAGFPIPPEKRPVRRLATNRVEFAPAVLAEAAACKARFSPARWRDFAADVAYFRSQLPPRTWAQAHTDHGFNATPAWAVAGSLLANTGPASDARIRALALLDPLLLVAAWAAVFAAFGWRAAAAALVFWGTNQPARSGWTIGAFLRQDWLAAALVGLALLRRGRLAAAGFALGAAAALRIVPGFLLAGLALRAAVRAARRRRLGLGPAGRRFAAGSGLALAGLLAASLALGGAGAWPGFVANSRKHLATPLTNFLGARTLASFDSDTTVSRLRDPAQPDPFTPWHEAQRANFARRAPLFWAGVAAFTALLALAAARETAWAAAILGVGLAVAAAQLGSYYYAILCCYGLLGPGREPIPIGLCLLSAASWGLADRVGPDDELAAWQSLACLVFVVAATAWCARRRPTRP
jgi:hypothetical protein